MATVTFCIPDALDEELVRQSTAARLSKDDLPREALQRYLQVRKFRALRSELVPLARMQRIHTDEDEFGALDKP